MENNVTESQPQATQDPVLDVGSIIEEIFLTFINALSGQSTLNAQDANGTFYPNSTVSTVCTNSLYVDWFLYTFIPAVLISIFLSFLQKRKRIGHGCCYGYPGIAYPVDIIDAGQDRLSYACAFGATTTSVLGLIDGDNWIDVDLSHTPEMVQGTLSLMMKMVNVLFVGIVFYPIFLCLSTRKSIVGNIIGLLYTASWLTYYVFNLVECSQLDEPGDTSLLLAIFTDIPNIVCLLILSIRFVVGVAFDVYNCCSKEKKKVLFQSDDFRKSHHYTYVKRLLNPTKNVRPPTCLDKFRKMLYQNKPGFKYSTRIVCAMAVAAIVLSQVSAIWGVVILSISEALKAYITQPEIAMAFDVSNYSQYHQGLVELAEVNLLAFEISFGFTLVLHYVFLPLMLVTYRQHMLMLYRGQRSIFPHKALTPASTLVYSWRYAGYQVAYLMWSWFLWQIVVWIICFLLFYAIFIPLGNGDSSMALDFIKSYWLTLVVGFVLVYFQVFLAKFVFLQDSGTVLGADNRRLFSVMFYVLFYYDMIIGLFSCLMRIIYAALFGLTFLGRTDNSVLMRKFELWDPGFKAYYGFLLVEEYHTHPVLVTFCNLLLESSSNNVNGKYGIAYTVDEEKVKVPEPALNEKGDHARTNVARNRWHLAYTLVNNPNLMKRRGTITLAEEVVDSSTAEEMPPPPGLDAVENGAITMFAAAAYT